MRTYTYRLRKSGAALIACNVLAHLYRRKGIHTLLRAFSLLRAGSVLRIVGIGPEKQRLEQLAAALELTGRVQFLGQLPFDALVAEYRNASVFALPTTQEGFGIVFLEAMASSLPIVACRAASVPEVVGDGLLVAPDDHEALADALRQLLDD